MRACTRILSALSILFVIASAQAAQDLPYYDNADFTPHWLAPNSKALQSFHTIPAFRFINQEGKTVTEANYKNKIYIATFFFSTCPGICPSLITKLAVVQKTFLDDDQVRILSHSVMPNFDTVEILKAYAATHKINSAKWDLVTGDKAAIYGIAKTAYFANEDEGQLADEGDFLHTEKLLLIDQHQHIRGVYNGMAETAIVDLIADIKALEANAAAAASERVPDMRTH